MAGFVSPQGPGLPLRAPDFILPSKHKAAIKIVAPSSSSAKDVIPSSQPSVASTDDVGSGNEGAIVPAKFVSSTVNITSTNDQPTPPPNIQQSAPSAQRVTLSSDLDIYARNYVPAWLKAVNESIANKRFSQSLNGPDYAEYISSYAGRGLLSAVPLTKLPDYPEINVQTHALQPQTYLDYWSERQHNEFVAFARELQSYSLYNVPVIAVDSSHLFYQIAVPGLREDAPMLNIGDVVCIRPLIEISERFIGTQCQDWYMSGRARNELAPGFSGIEYHSVVHRVARQAECVVLRIDEFQPQYHRCNVTFVPQQYKLARLWRSIRSINDRFLAESRHDDTGWLHSMLFPHAIDGNVQHELSKATFNLNWNDVHLNIEQKKAVQAVVEANYGRVPFLISGPPGTGKTKALVEVALQLLSRPGPITPHLLICAPSDPAADTILRRLAVHLPTTALLRLNGWTRSLVELTDDVFEYSCTKNDMFSIPDFEAMMSFQIVVTTCRDAAMLVDAQLTNQSLTNLVLKTTSLIAPGTKIGQDCIHWTAFLLDEAAQATEPEALIPLSVVVPLAECNYGQSAFPQVVMAGDEYQLGPRTSLKGHKRNSIHASLFQRLFRRPFYSDHPLARSKRPKQLTSAMLPMIRPAFCNLVRNYRSHPAILSVPSVLFYHDTLIPEASNISPEVRNSVIWHAPYRWPILFHNITSLDEVESITAGDGTGTGTVYNVGEADLALHYARILLSQASAGSPIYEHDIVVMSPFAAQVNLLRRKFREVNLYGVNIGPLEVFQGLEGRIVILCTTRTRLGGRTYSSQQNLNNRYGVHPSGGSTSSNPLFDRTNNKFTSSTNSNTDNNDKASLDPDKREKFIREDQARGLGVIDEPKRFNVAITRAREGLIVIGNSETLTCTGDRAWKAFLAFARRNACITGDDSEDLFNGQDSLGGFMRGKEAEMKRHTEVDTGVQPEGSLEWALKYKSRHDYQLLNGDENGKVLGRRALNFGFGGAFDGGANSWNGYASGDVQGEMSLPADEEDSEDE